MRVLNPGVVNFPNRTKGFRRNHSMIVGIQPRDDNFEEKVYQTFVPCIYSSDDSPWLQKSPKKEKTTTESIPDEDKSQYIPETDTPSLQYTTGKYLFHLTSNTYDDKDFMISVALVKDGKIVKNLTNGHYSVNIEGPDYTVCNLVKSFGSVPQVADGIYELRPIYYNLQSGWNICPIPSQYVAQVEIAKNATKINFINAANDGVKVDSLFIESVTPASEIYAGTKFYLNVKARGYVEGGFPQRTVGLNFRNVETGKVYGYYKDADSQNTIIYDFCYNDYTQSLIFPFFPKSTTNGFSMPAGRYKVEVADSYDFAKVMGDFYIDVKEKPTYPVLDGNSLAYMYVSISDQNEMNQLRDMGYITKSNEYSWTSASCNFGYANKTEDPVTIRLYLVNRDTGEGCLIHQQDNWIPGQSIDLNMRLYPLVGNYEFKFRYVTPDGEREGLMPTSYYEKDSESIWRYRYRITDDTPSPYYLSNFMSAYSKRVGPNYVDVSIAIQPQQYAKGNSASVKLFLINEQTGDAIIATKKNLTMREESATTIDFSLPLSSDASYEGYMLYCSDGDWCYFYVLNRDNEIARFTIRKDGSLVGIRQTQSLSHTKFSMGEQVKVFDTAGKLLLNTTYSPNIWSELDSALPHGVFILQSASHSMKLSK